MSNSGSVRFLYTTALGRGILKTIQTLHMDRIAVWYLRSPLSKAMISGYIRRNHIPMEQYVKASYGSFRDFFLREKKDLSFDSCGNHFISPCDGWLSVCPIEENASFFLKGSHYQISDLVPDPQMAQLFRGGQCLIFRLCASDYHHYCYIDDGNLEKTCYKEGVLHSVQPIACQTYPVFSLNRRVCSLLHTEHFGPLIQTEIGALVVGGIVNHQTSGAFRRGQEKGHFDLSGSTIVCFVQKDAVELLPEIRRQLERQPEVRVELGMHIGMGEK